MTTFQDLINDTRHHLMTSQPDRMNVLDVSISPSDTSFVVRYIPKGIDEGARITVDLEEMHVISISGSTAGSAVEVIRGFDGSVAVSHLAGTPLRVNPQFSDFKIGKRINDCINGVSPGEGLFFIKPLEFTFIPSVAGYSLTAPDMIGIWRVVSDETGPSKRWPILGAQDFYFDLNPNLTDFPGGVQFVLRRGGGAGRLIRISYKARFVPLVNVADDVQTVGGLLPSMHDIPPLGAAIRLLAGRDVKRSFLNRQPEPRRQEEVPPGAASQAMRPLVQLYYDAIDREIRTLHKLYPPQQ